MLKRCLWCKHFDLSLGEAGYSEWTPGYPGHVDCDKTRHWYGFQSEGADRADLFEKARIAEACPDYEMEEGLLAEGKGRA